MFRLANAMFTETFDLTDSRNICIFLCTGRVKGMEKGRCLGLDVGLRRAGLMQVFGRGDFTVYFEFIYHKFVKSIFLESIIITAHERMIDR